jgi:hypothetical protein
MLLKIALAAFFFLSGLIGPYAIFQGQCQGGWCKECCSKNPNTACKRRCGC